MGGKSSSRQLEDTMFNMRLTAKQLVKESQRSEKEEKLEKEKAKRYLEKGLIDSARIHAENGIRKKNEALNYLRLSSKMDAVASKIATAARTEQMTQQFARVIPQMNRVLQNMNLQNISETMSNFEKVFEDLDVASGYINESLSQSTSVSTPKDQVDSLLRQIADEHNIEVQGQMGEIPLSVGGAPVTATNSEDLNARFQRLG
jgi:charged multivesicular body protein 1